MWWLRLAKCWHFKCAPETNRKPERAKCICTLAAQLEPEVCVCLPHLLPPYFSRSLSLCMCSYICLCANKQQAFSNSIKAFFVYISWATYCFRHSRTDNWTVLSHCQEFCGENCAATKAAWDALDRMNFQCLNVECWDSSNIGSKGQMLNKLNKTDRMLKIHSRWPQKCTRTHISILHP